MNDTMLAVTVNGRSERAATGTTIASLLTERGQRIEWVVVELNGEALPRGAYAETVLADGDRLEVVRAVAGGAL